MAELNQYGFTPEQFQQLQEGYQTWLGRAPTEQDLAGFVSNPGLAASWAGDTTSFSSNPFADEILGSVEYQNRAAQSGADFTKAPLYQGSDQAGQMGRLATLAQDFNNAPQHQLDLQQFWDTTNNTVAQAEASNSSFNNSAYNPNNASGGSHYVTGPNGEKIQLVASAADFNPTAAMQYLNQIASGNGFADYNTWSQSANPENYLKTLTPETWNTFTNMYNQNLASMSSPSAQTTSFSTGTPTTSTYVPTTVGGGGQTSGTPTMTNSGTMSNGGYFSSGSLVNNTNPATLNDIRGLYRQYLGRDPGEAANQWIGKPLSEIYNGIIGSPEYYAYTSGNPQNTIITPGKTNADNQMNVAEWAGNIAGDPSKFFTTDDPTTPHINESMFMSDRNQQIDPNATGTDINGQDPKYQIDPDKYQATAASTQNRTGEAATYDAALTWDMINNMINMQGAQGQVNQDAIINADDVTLDLEAITDPNTALGKALQDYAYQDMSTVIDTSTAQGKLLAEQLGRFNYVDSKATLQGQMELLQSQFQDANGDPRIPPWASGIARNVSKIAAFKGITGTAATEAMTNALMESSIPIAQQDAAFFQSLTLKNLDNKQQQTINTANVLSKMALTNADNRLAAAIQNSRNFMEMDLANLDNEQQARVINTQARIQSILEDANQENVARRFGAEATNNMDQFYSNLNASIDQFNAAQYNDMEKFNSTLSDAREKFYSSMQFQIDQSNAEWRRNVTLTEDAQQFEAAATDVKNMVGIANEAFNQLWDRSDALLDYIWKTSDNQKQRDHELLLTNIKTQADIDAANAARADAESTSLGNLIGVVGGGLLDKALGWF